MTLFVESHPRLSVIKLEYVSTRAVFKGRKARNIG